jgi:rhodanese-related sulfurtransferase
MIKMKKIQLLTATSVILALTAGGASALFAEEARQQAKPAVNLIAPGLESVPVIHYGKKMTITRTGDKTSLVPKAYQHTGRHCPPFCVQPMKIAPNIETVGELEVLNTLKAIGAGDTSSLVVDSRTPDWLARGTIPGAVNIPWNKINVSSSGNLFATEEEAETLNAIMTQHFGAKKTDKGWDFSGAKTLTLFCNGNWCPQSAANIKTLLRLGYPAEKLKWYRGGMQSWVSLGLSTVYWKDE